MSLTEDDWKFVDDRATELKLDRAKARSLYFQMMVDLDRKMRFSKHGHKGDGQWHLYEESQDTYAVGTPETTLPAEKAARQELARRTQPATPARTPQSNPPLSGRK